MCHMCQWDVQDCAVFDGTISFHQIEVISATKANILKNDDKIQKMLNSIAFLST